MSCVRIVVVDAEGDAQALAAAMEMFAARLAGTRKDAAAPADVAVAPRAIVAPANKRMKRRALAAPVPAAAEEEPVTLVDMVRAAVRESPRTNAEVRDAVGRAGGKRDQVDGALWALRKRNEIYKGEDLKWRFAAGK